MPAATATRSRPHALLGMLFLVGACSTDSARNHFLLGEKLWTEQRYAASIAEYEKTISRDPGGRFGIQALYRAALTQTLYLNQHEEALRKLKRFVELADESEAKWEARVQIGEILFGKVERYDEALAHYQALVKLRPSGPQAPEMHFRIAKSQFFLRKFDDAMQTYREIQRHYPGTPLAERSAYELGMTYLTRASQQTEERTSLAASYQEALDVFQAFLRKYPKSRWAVEARFGIANCLEEMDQLEAAYRAFEELKAAYPSPAVVETRMIRIRERLLQRKR